MWWSMQPMDAHGDDAFQHAYWPDRTSSSKAQRPRTSRTAPRPRKSPTMSSTSIRRECIDHFVVLGEAHLRRILRAYVRYYNDIRTHRSLDKA